MLLLKRILLVTLLLPTISISQEADIQAGKNLFNSNCAACHQLNRKAVGPALSGVSEKYDREWLYSWIKNGTQMIKDGDPQAVSIWEEYNRSIMTNYPQFSNEQIDNILAYTDYTPPPPVAAVLDTAQVAGQGSDLSLNIILAVSIVIFTILIVMLFLVQRTLLKIANASGVKIEAEPKKRLKPLWKLVIENQFLMIIVVVGLLLSSAYFTYGYLMQIGIDQGYAPIQPIHYSHKIHAGQNGIDCKYCHSSARVSKHSGIPSLNVCMNCHKSIYEVAPSTATEEYSKEFYDAEIQKLYNAVGWDDVEQKYTGKTKPVKWIRIHNLPDFAYFNHSQHVTVAGVECQTCHGPVEEMEIMYQHSPLTMGWCINCHRETNVKVEDNGYYEKIHEALSKKYGVDKLTAAQMGGLECGKCHY
jgi:mono/diheme cytochrome c family protein